MASSLPVRILLMLGAGALPLVVGCREPVAHTWASDLAEAESRWNASGVTSYQYDVFRHCFCGSTSTRPVTVTVRNRAFVSLVYMDSGTVADTSLFRPYLTIERFFALLHDVLDSGPASFDAEYASAGFPTVVVVDPDAAIADEEFSVQVLAFRRQTAAIR